MSLEEEVSKIFKDYAVQKVQLIKYIKMVYKVEEEGGGQFDLPFDLPLRLWLMARMRIDTIKSYLSN